MSTFQSDLEIIFHNYPTTKYPDAIEIAFNAAKKSTLPWEAIFMEGTHIRANEQVTSSSNISRVAKGCVRQRSRHIRNESTINYDPTSSHQIVVIITNNFPGHDDEPTFALQELIEAKDIAIAIGQPVLAKFIERDRQRCGLTIDANTNINQAFSKYQLGPDLFAYKVSELKRQFIDLGKVEITKMVDHYEIALRGVKPTALKARLTAAAQSLNISLGVDPRTPADIKDATKFQTTDSGKLKISPDHGSTSDTALSEMLAAQKKQGQRRA